MKFKCSKPVKGLGPIPLYHTVSTWISIQIEPQKIETKIVPPQMQQHLESLERSCLSSGVSAGKTRVSKNVGMSVMMSRQAMY